MPIEPHAARCFEAVAFMNTEVEILRRPWFARVAKMEAGDASVSVDLLLRALFALGARPEDVASILVDRRVA